MIKNIEPGVEQGFRKSSFSDTARNGCVEAADSARGTYLRDTTQRELGALLFSSPAWARFTRAAAAEGARQS